LAVLGDLKGMSPQWLRGASFKGYGSTLAIGIGIPIPVLDEEVVQSAAVKDADIWAPIVDYSKNYPERDPAILGEVNYAQLKTGAIEIRGKKVPSAGLSSYFKAREIAGSLKASIKGGRFLLTEPVAFLPNSSAGLVFKPLSERPVGS
jgi:uncharacterized protein (DUF39 family)